MSRGNRCANSSSADGGRNGGGWSQGVDRGACGYGGDRSVVVDRISARVETAAPTSSVGSFSAPADREDKHIALPTVCKIPTAASSEVITDHDIPDKPPMSMPISVFTSLKEGTCAVVREGAKAVCLVGAEALTNDTLSGDAKAAGITCDKDAESAHSACMEVGGRIIDKIHTHEKKENEKFQEKMEFKREIEREAAESNKHIQCAVAREVVHIGCLASVGGKDDVTFAPDMHFTDDVGAAICKDTADIVHEKCMK